MCVWGWWCMCGVESFSKQLKIGDLQIPWASRIERTRSWQWAWKQQGTKQNKADTSKGWSLGSQHDCMKIFLFSPFIFHLISCMFIFYLPSSILYSLSSTGPELREWRRKTTTRDATKGWRLDSHKRQERCWTERMQSWQWLLFTPAGVGSRVPKRITPEAQKNIIPEIQKLQSLEVNTPRKQKSEIKTWISKVDTFGYCKFRARPFMITKTGMTIFFLSHPHRIVRLINSIIRKIIHESIN